VAVAQQSYLSPRRYVLGGYGADTSSFTAAQLRQKLIQATSAVDTFCNRSMNPQRSDMRGGTIIGEQHAWPVQDPYVPLPGGRRVYLNSTPIRSVSRFSIQFTNSWSMSFPVSNLFVNGTGGYVEIVATQPTIVGYPPVGIWFGLSEPVLSVDYDYGWQFPVVDDTCEADSPLLYYASHGNWLSTADVEVSVAGAVIDPSDYTINYDDGSILFALAAEPAADQEVLVSYTYTLPQAIADAVGIIATDRMGQSAIARRGMIGLSSLKVAEVSLTQMQPGNLVTRNGITIPAAAADLLGPYALGRIG
jgi:hypothetical protein